MAEKMSCACPRINAYDCIRARYPSQYICHDHWMDEDGDW
jgi:hypothetical protein